MRDNRPQMGQLATQHPLHLLPAPLLPYRISILSYASSLFSTTIGFPLDSIKTRMQTHHYRGTLHCLRATLKHEGPSGLYRGITAPLVSSSLSRSLSMSVFTQSKPYLQQFNLFRPSQSALLTALNNLPHSVAAGFLAGGTTSLFACPFEFTKLFSQLYVLAKKDLGLVPRRMPKTTYQVVKRIVREEGLAGLYSGFRLHFLRDAFGSAVYFGTYETSKIIIESLADPNGYIPNTPIPVGTVSITTAGALSGIFSWVVVFPIDTVKSLYQRDVVSNIIRSLALKPRQAIRLRKISLPTRDMYRGLSVSITRSVITSVAFFTCFEYLTKHVT